MFYPSSPGAPAWATASGTPSRGIPNVKVEQKVIQPLSEEQIQALLDLCDPAEEFGRRSVLTTRRR